MTEASAPDPTHPMSDRAKLALFAVMAFGQFMALLDTQIVASSLNSIQAGLLAGPDEVAWIQTSYLMAEIVMIPLAAFLAKAMSTRWLFTLSAALFTLSSLACGLAWNIESMIVFRAIQGFVGGAMVPTVFATGFVLFQGPRRAMVPAVLGMVSTLAPTLGPTLGGWITEHASWRWMFFINIAPGLLIAIAVPILGKVDLANTRMFRRIDWLQVLGLALFLGALQYVLEEGPREQWFEDPTIAVTAWLSFIGAVVFFERSICSETPVVKLSPFRNPTFALACALNFIIGVGLYSAIYLVPVFLGQVRDFTSLDIGLTVFVTGFFMFFAAPLAARMSTRVDPRYVISAGFLLFSLGIWLLTGITAEWGFGELFLPQAVRGFAVLLCIVPAVGLALSTPSPAELPYASGLFNVMRNLGGAVGIATVNTWLQDFTRMHALRIGEAMGHGGGDTDSLTSALARQLEINGNSDALIGAQAQLTAIVTRAAAVEAFRDVFYLLAGLFIVALVIVPFCKRPPLPGQVTAPSPAAPTLARVGAH